MPSARSRVIMAAVFAFGAASAVRADEAGENLCAAYLAALGKLKSVQADFTNEARFGTELTSKSSGFIAIRRPNQVRIHTEEKVNKRVEESVSDGKKAYAYASDSGRVSVGTADRYMKEWLGLGAEVVYLPEKIIADIRKLYGSPTVGKPIKIGGQECQTLEFGKDGDYYRFYLGPDKLPRGLDTKMADLVSVERLSNIRVNQPVPAKTFQWMPPAKAAREPMFP